MNIEQLQSHYARLRQDLHAAYSAPSWQAGKIDRLAEELAHVEREIARRQPSDEQTGESFPAFAFTK